MESTYKQCFVEGKKGEQRCYIASVIISFYCLSISLGESSDVVSLPILSINLPLEIAQYVLLAMYSVSGIWGAFYTLKAHSALQGLKDSKSNILEALKTYPSVFNANWLWVLLAISLPIIILSTAFVAVSNKNIFMWIYIALFFSMGMLFPLLKPNITSKLIRPQKTWARTHKKRAPII